MELTFGSSGPKPPGTGGGLSLGGGLFSKKEEKPEDGKNLEELSNVMKDIVRRMRVLEERYGNTRKVIQVNEQNMISESKKFHQDLRSMHDEMTELKKLMRDMSDEVKLIVSELRECVKKDQMKVLEKYLEMWEPVNFVSHREIEGIVREILEKKELEKQKKTHG